MKTIFALSFSMLFAQGAFAFPLADFIFGDSVKYKGALVSPVAYARAISVINLGGKKADVRQAKIVFCDPYAQPQIINFGNFPFNNTGRTLSPGEETRVRDLGGNVRCIREVYLLADVSTDGKNSHKTYLRVRGF